MTKKTKVCNKCEKRRLVKFFHKNSTTPDGLDHRCKSCKAAYMKKYCEENKEALKASWKKYREENKEARKAYNKKHYQENKEVYKAYDKKRYDQETHLGFLRTTYKGMKHRVMGRSSNPRARLKFITYYLHLPICSRKEFLDWASNDPTFLKLHRQWLDYGKEYRLTPSIDRIDSDKGYTLDNMQWLTVSENSRKAGYKTQGQMYEAS